MNNLNNRRSIAEDDGVFYSEEKENMTTTTTDTTTETRTPTPTTETLVLTPVKSSSVAAVGYATATRTLAVQFGTTPNSGAVYLYHGVPQTVVSQFVEAESIGQFFNTRIKPNYEVTKIDTTTV